MDLSECCSHCSDFRCNAINGSRSDHLGLFNLINSGLVSKAAIVQ